MKKYEVAPQAATTKKPAKAAVSDSEFRRRLKNISEWRKKRLAQLRSNANTNTEPGAVATGFYSIK